MTAERFEPKFTTSTSAQEAKKEARERIGRYFGDRVSTSEGTKAPTNVKTQAPKWKKVQDVLDFDEAQKAQQSEIDKNKMALRRNKDLWTRGRNGHA